MPKTSRWWMRQQTKKVYKDPKEAKIDELGDQVENLHLMMMKQPRQAQKPAEPVCYKCARNAITHHSIGWSKNLRVTSVVRMGTEILDVPRKSICNLRAHILTELDTLLKTVSSRRATKLEKRKIWSSPRTVSQRNSRELGRLGRTISCSWKKMILLKKKIPWQRSRDQRTEKCSLSNMGCKTTSMPIIKRRGSLRLLWGWILTSRALVRFGRRVGRLEISLRVRW